MQVDHDHIKPKKELQIKYLFVDCEQLDRQKRLDDAFDLIFDEVENDDIERINKKDEYEHAVIIKR